LTNHGSVSLDYNLDLDERRKKYKDYDHIFCGKCKQEINKEDYYCTNCYNKEIDIYKKYYIKFGPSKESKIRIFKMSDYDLDKSERQKKYKDYCAICENCNQEISKRDYKCDDCYNKEIDSNEKIRMRLGRCKECYQVNKYSNRCLSCIIKHFKKDFSIWTSGNKIIDKLIQENQLS